MKPDHTSNLCHLPATVPQRSITRRALLASAAAVAAGAAGPVWAAFPERPVKLMIGFSAGTAPDVIARSFQEPLAAALGQGIVIENRPGAGAQIAAGATASAAADGYTLLFAEVGSTLVAQAAYSRLPYNTSRDLRVVATLTETPMVFVTGVNGPRNLHEFMSKAKSSKDTLLATFGPGSTAHLMQSMWATSSGFTWEPVHFRALGDLMTSLVSGDVVGTFVAPSTAQSFIQAGKLRPLAITSPSRLDLLPQVPTFTEEGVPNLQIMLWLSVFAPARTPQAVIDRLTAALSTAMADPKVRSLLASQGTLTHVRTGQQAQRYLQEEKVWWETAVKTSGFKGD